VNFAHGDIYMIGAFQAMIMLLVCGALGITWVPAILMLMLIV
jgi:branched-chain amino acid transport system permease protein